MNDYGSRNPRPSLLIWGLIKGQPPLTADTLAWRWKHPRIARQNLLFTLILFPVPSFLHRFYSVSFSWLIPELPACAPRQHKETTEMKTKISGYHHHHHHQRISSRRKSYKNFRAAMCHVFHKIWKTSEPFFHNLAKVSVKPIGPSCIIYHRCILEWKSPLNLGIPPDLEFGLRIRNADPNQICLDG